jgi:hypothetical protein
MRVPNDIQFPEYTNPAINTALLADKVNELLAYLREQNPEPTAPNAFAQERKLKDGVTQAKSGTFMLNGKFIRKEEAYL